MKRRGCCIEKLKKKSGFTLLELIVVIGVLGLVLIAVGGFLIDNLRVYNETSNQLKTQEESYRVMDAVSKAAIQAGSISSITQPNWNETDITFLSQRVEATTTTESNRFRLASEVVSQEVSGGAANILSSHVTQFEIRPIQGAFVVENPLEADYLSSNTTGVDVRVTIRYGNQTSQLKNQFYFRNH